MDANENNKFNKIAFLKTGKYNTTCAPNSPSNKT
jgi:hypothetical protein